MISDGFDAKLWPCAKDSKLEIVSQWPVGDSSNISPVATSHFLNNMASELTLKNEFMGSIFAKWTDGSN